MYQLFSMVRHARCFKLGTKPGWLTAVRYLILKLSSFSAKAKEFFQRTFIYTLSATGVLDSWEEFCIYAYVAVSNSWFECSTHWGSIYIVIHRQTVSLYHNSSVWLDTRDASSWDRNPADFTSVGYLTPEKSSFSFRLYIYIYIYIYSWERICKCTPKKIDENDDNLGVSQPGFDPSLKHLACLTILKRSDTNKPGWLYVSWISCPKKIVILISSYIYI